MNKSGKEQVFISHSTKDKIFAEFFKEWIEENFEEKKVFLSSCPKDLSCGEVWLKEIEEKCFESSYFISLLSYDSIESDWIKFEAGLFLGTIKAEGREIKEGDKKRYFLFL